MDDLGSMAVLFWALSWISSCSGGNHTDYKAPDVEAARDKERIIGICVGAGLAMVFLVLLCISYTYYKRKPVDEKPDDVQKIQPKPQKPVFKSNIVVEKRGVENVTMDTRF